MPAQVAVALENSPSNSARPSRRPGRGHVLPRQWAWDQIPNAL